MSDKPASYWSDTQQGLRAVELRAAGFEPSEAEPWRASI